jgi:GTP cyclohydrolase I
MKPSVAAASTRQTNADELSGEKDAIAREILGDKYADRYATPNREYDHNLDADGEYVASLPDLQNGPSSLIRGAAVAIEQVGIHNFRLPITYRTRDNGNLTLETSVTGSVSLEAHKKGINMSRIMRGFYGFKDRVFSIGAIRDVLDQYREYLDSFDARIMLKFSYPIVQQSLRSGNAGYQYYDVVFEGHVDRKGHFKKFIHFDFVYSSACPCSYELGQHAVKYRNQAVVPHSQRSVARISVEFRKEIVWIEDLQELCLEALATETQVIVKREDEQAFAELNGSNLKFVEDAARLLYDRLDADSRIVDFKVVASHQESLHSHDAVAVITKGVPGGLIPEVPRETFNSLIHLPR